MPSPFPGMNPYLENPNLWSEVHSRLIVAVANAIVPQLSQNYRVAIEKRTYFNVSMELVGIPDVTVISRHFNSIGTQPTTTQHSSSTSVLTRVEPTLVKLPMPSTIKEGYLEIREGFNGKVITVIEIISPTNKRSGLGRDEYEKKRNAVLHHQTNLVEIDLLRGGKQMPLLEVKTRDDYRILVCRGEELPQGRLYAFSIRQPIPIFPIPLKAGEIQPEVNLQELLNEIYDQARFDLAIDYLLEPVPPLKLKDREWANVILQEQRRR
ncbi:hypothetical protein BCD67_02330 [Oscillatoriales cyanobacterium USR001]|nr:hypothetical protein BCD67_02330 [Oscillatoriales cyanobacterium USR001]